MRTRLIAAILLLGSMTACAEDPATRANEDSTAASTPTPASTDPTPEQSPSPSARPTEQQTEQPAEQGQKVVAAESEFGPVLFDETGQAMYLFDVETTSRPRCYGPCADAWPPVLTDGTPVAGKRVRQSLLGTTERTDGTTQVTYDGHPLYFYAHEGKHEVECHDIFLNGGTWYAVKPNGDRAP